MALSDKKILEAMQEGSVIIEPFKRENLATSSYDVTLGEHFFREQPTKYNHSLYNIWSRAHMEHVWGASKVERAVPAKEAFEKYNFEWDGISPEDKVIILRPGETILAHTNEFIGGRDHITTMMKARSSMGRNFIEVCKCAGWGDVGYVNRWTMEITNNSKNYIIPLVVGRRIAQIIFFETGPILQSDYTKSGKYQVSTNLEEVKSSWTPEQMLPRLYLDRDIGQRAAPAQEQVQKGTATKYEDLKHVRKPLPGNGQVVVLDTGAIINAEEDAMLQALHSRSLGGIDAHLIRLAKRGAQDFMQTYYVGYGDKSIGDDGTATIFIEGVSMLAAKAVQDSQLYNGQESSTRYIDFSKQAFGNPHNSPEGAELLESLRAFHLNGLETMKEELAKRHPRQTDEDEKVWQKAINARAFDIMRGFLPAGAATNLAWHTELRHASDHLLRLRHHPLAEVRDIANAVGEALMEKYPNSGFAKRYSAQEEYVEEWMQNAYYYSAEAEPTLNGSKAGYGNVLLLRNTVEPRLLQKHRHILDSRPAKAELPKFLAEAGGMQFSFPLDFGSFRDLHRHRSITQRMPLLTTKHGFGEWYFSQVPQQLADEAKAFLARYVAGLERLNLSPTLAQYYVPMGYQVACRITGDLPALAFVVELRSGISVHPTLRVISQNIGALMLRELKSEGLILHIDSSEDRFNYKRGTQDIVERNPVAAV
ncbi:MAG TPA: FAD-dependent thymidylate synthase [Candidatus Paceibacterota bacterium]|nr:FAD-dependent thymidylate synthase [Candidatus Paceibacterota bacterium]